MSIIPCTLVECQLLRACCHAYLECSHGEAHVLQLPGSASRQQQAAKLPKYQQGHKESVIILGHAVPHHLHNAATEHKEWRDTTQV